jgi:hypothetical protein
MKKLVLFLLLGSVCLAAVGCGAGGQVTETDTMEKQKEIDEANKKLGQSPDRSQN